MIGNKLKVAILAPAVALILAGGGTQACRSSDMDIPPYRVEHKSYYHDLILDIAAKGEMSFSHAGKFQKEENDERKGHPADLTLRVPSQPPSFLAHWHDARPCAACLPETSLSQAAEVCRFRSKVEGDKVRLR